jgi:hypothetical protein
MFTDEAPKATQSRVDKQDAEDRVLKGKTITSLLLTRHGINVDEECIYISGEIDKAFEDTLLETPRNACKEYFFSFFFSNLLNLATHLLKVAHDAAAADCTTVLQYQYAYLSSRSRNG